MFTTKCAISTNWRSYKQQETDRQGAHGSTTSQPGLVSFACRKDNVLIHSVPLFVNTPILEGKCYMLHVFFPLHLANWLWQYNSSQSASSGSNHNRIMDFCLQFSVGGESSCPRMKKQRSTICWNSNCRSRKLSQVWFKREEDLSLPHSAVFPYPPTSVQ